MAATAEQQEKLSNFLAVVGDMVDPDVARTMLESAAWDVELVLNGVLEDGAPAPRAALASTTPVVETIEDNDTEAVASRQGSGAPMKEDFSRFCVEDLCAFLDAQGVPRYGCLDKDQLVRMLSDSVNGIQRPQEPRSTSPEVPPNHGNDLLQWARNVASGQCDIPPPGWPAGALFEPPCRSRAREVSPEVEEQRKAEKEDKAQQNAERQVDIAMQDAEFQESLLMDQLRETERIDAEEAQQKLQEEQLKLQEAEARASEETQQEMEAKRQRLSQPEPDKAHSDRCQIVIRTPSGKRLSRTFLGSDEVSFLYDWVDVACPDEEFSKQSYRLVSRLPGRPSKDLCKTSQSLTSEGIEHQTMFFITCCE